MPFWSKSPPPQEEQPSKPQPPSFANLHPQVATGSSNNKHQGLGIGRDSQVPGTSSTAVITTNDLDTKGNSKLYTDCKAEYLASINCRLEHHDHKTTNVCQPFFDEYKACRKEEHQRILEENAKRSGW
ncbi:expressed unknown protein [Seminavis robusta]|uniref:CHCH domain-containing protein n=1 Tax=Seminavis robusta TaxID=568900 RepID=A0A9N8EEA6_9STRA|nr:expressed unknown protein [Seminavis robusta]|eukprot:Sro814_g206250.1 n/a (128) ;mRNA; f:3590-3973